MSFSTVWNTVYPIIAAILFFELIIIIHEGGHFAAARLMKIKVNEFSVGMGPKIFSLSRRGTKFSLRWVLFGGYCAMEGEDKDSSEKGSFSSKSPAARMFVVAAGAIMNLLLGFVLVVALVSSSELVGTTTVARFDDNAVSAASGLQAGDVIKSIDGMRVYTSTDVSTGLSRSADSTVEMDVVRNGEKLSLDVSFDTTEENGTQFIKMDFWLLGNEKTFLGVVENSLATFISYIRMVFLSVADIISGRFGLSDLSGPVGAVSAVSTAVKTGSGMGLRLMALLTINVGLFNLFPIPALDGWRFFMLLGEALFKKKLPPKWEYAVNAAGLAVLLGIMVIVTFSDVTKLF